MEREPRNREKEIHHSDRRRKWHQERCREKKEVASGAVQCERSRKVQMVYGFGRSVIVHVIIWRKDLNIQWKLAIASVNGRARSYSFVLMEVIEYLAHAALILCNHVLCSDAVMWIYVFHVSIYGLWMIHCDFLHLYKQHIWFNIILSFTWFHDSNMICGDVS